MMEFQYEHQNQQQTIRLESNGDAEFTAVIGERELHFHAKQQADGAWLLTIGQRQIRAYIFADGDMRFVYADGQTTTLTALDERTGRSRRSQSGGGLTAQMPGQVVEVLVEQGEQVSNGQTLVILEAMKMEIRVSAPADGTVKAVFVSQGDVVQRGEKLVEIE